MAKEEKVFARQGDVMRKENENKGKSEPRINLCEVYSAEGNKLILITIVLYYSDPVISSTAFISIITSLLHLFFCMSLTPEYKRDGSRHFA